MVTTTEKTDQRVQVQTAVHHVAKINHAVVVVIVVDQMEIIEAMIDQKVQIQIEAVQITVVQTTGPEEDAVVVVEGAVLIVAAVEVAVAIIFYLVEKNEQFTFNVHFELSL